ncbi:MAG: hypothetical protein V4850_24665 [Myxococcota bacterium]
MLRRVLVTFALAQSLASAVAWACSCDTPDHTGDDVILVGVPGPTTPPTRGCGGGSDPVSTNHVTTFTVTDACRGDLGATVEVWHGTDGDSCGVEFVEDAQTLVFASFDGEGRLVTSLCAGNVETDAAECAANGF